jgi:hypothetical protein
LSAAAAEVALPKGSASAAKLAAATAATAALPLPTPPPLYYHRQRRTLAKPTPPLPSWPPPQRCRRASAAVASRGKDRNRCAANAMPTATTAATLPASCRRCHRCRRASRRGAAASDAALPPSCQAGCHRHAATPLAPPQYCNRPAAALPAAAALLRPFCRPRAATTVAAPAPPLPC